jgi:hypothetical protein
MEKIMKKIILVAGLISITGAELSHADSTKTLERGRTELLTTLLTPELEPEQRLEKLAILKKDQMNIEQMVAREKYTGKNLSKRTQMLTDYNKYFLVHAAYESNRTLSEHWFNQMGLSSNLVRRAKVGSR